MKGKHFEYEAFRKRLRYDYHMVSVCDSLVQLQFENDIVIVHFQMSPVQCGKHLMRFRSENAVFKFLRLGIDGVYKEAVFRTEVMRGTRV